MNRLLLCLFAFATFAPVARPADVLVSAADLGLTRAAGLRVTLTPTGSQRINTTNLIVRSPKSGTLSADGLLTFSNVVAGNYTLTLQSTPPTPYTIGVPETNAALNASLLVDASTEADVATILDYVGTGGGGSNGVSVAAGTNVVAVTNAGVVTISALPGGQSVAAGTNVVAVTNGSTVTISAEPGGQTVAAGTNVVAVTNGSVVTISARTNLATIASGYASLGDATVSNTLSAATAEIASATITNINGVFAATNLATGAPSAGQIPSYVAASGKFAFSNAPSGTGSGLGASNFVSNLLRFGETNIIVTNPAPVLLDLHAWHLFRVLLLTNASLVFTNPGAGILRGQLVLQQDTNGQRTTSFSLAGGNLQTNASLQITTNANALDIIELASSYFATNLLVWREVETAPDLTISDVTNSVWLAMAGNFSLASNLVVGGSITTPSLTIGTSNRTTWPDAATPSEVVAATNAPSITNWINFRMVAHSVLTNLLNLASYSFTNQPVGGTNMSVRTVGGTNYFDTTGFLNNWSRYSTNVWNTRQGGSAVLTNLAANGITFPGTASIESNIISEVWTTGMGFIPTNSAISNIIIPLGRTNYVQMWATNNLTFTNFVSTLISNQMAVAEFWIVPQLIDRGVNWGTLGAPGYGVRIFTNQTSTMWTTLTNGKTYWVQYRFRGTNGHIRISLEE